MAQKNKQYTLKRIKAAQSANEQMLITLSEEFMSTVLANNFDYESKEVLLAFQNCDLRWRNHIRGYINKFRNLYDDTKKRTNLTNTFAIQVRKLKEANNKPIGELLDREPEVVFNWSEQPVEKIIEAFKITLPKYNSKARTIKGLQKNYDELEPDQRIIFENNLKELIVSN